MPRIRRKGLNYLRKMDILGGNWLQISSSSLLLSSSEAGISISLPGREINANNQPACIAVVHYTHVYLYCISMKKEQGAILYRTTHTHTHTTFLFFAWSDHTWRVRFRIAKSKNLLNYGRVWTNCVILTHIRRIMKSCAVS
jgi:hypothetical protein